MDARKYLHGFQLSSDEFYGLFSARELPKSRYIYLDQLKSSSMNGLSNPMLR